MERYISCLLLLPTFYIFNTPPCTTTSALTISKVVHYSDEKKWLVARNFCRTHHTDLVTIKSKLVADQLVSFQGWIGLYYSSLWRWSKGAEPAVFMSWDSGEPDRYELCAMKYSSHQSWSGNVCQDLYPFLCMDERLILVREKKTWEAAFFHCKQLKDALSAAGASLPPDSQYNLASLPEPHYLLLEGLRIGSSTANEVWVGLRYLAGRWLWVNGEETTSSYLPRCPTQHQHCGALSQGDNKWKIMSCSERRHFICSI